ncbi:MAG: LrgB family protein [Clostridiales bacterium]|nr:LrgB family protein [Clostridiales bacterium]
MRKKTCFFDDLFFGLLYMLVIVAMPIASLCLQFCFNDRTYYLSYFITGLTLSFDHIVLYTNRNIVRRLWVELIVSFLCAVVTSIIAIVKISVILTQNQDGQVFTYAPVESLTFLVVGILLIINIVELGIIAKCDYRQRYPTETNSDGQSLIGGARMV